MAKYFRRVIRIAATDSPNVQLALREIELGLPISNTIVTPGVLTWEQYQERLATWDKQRRCVGLCGEFYEGEEVKLYPEAWLNLSHHLWKILKDRMGKRTAKALGVDPGEGDADTAWAVGDEYGLLDLIVEKTPNTRDVQTRTIEIGMKWGIGSHNWVYDRGGGGLQHSDTLRAMGYACTTVGFGEGIVLLPRRGMTRIEEKIEVGEERYAYKNRRAQMYGELSELMDPTSKLRDHLNPRPPMEGYAIPPASEGPQFKELRRQMESIPKLRDKEDQLYLPPKHKGLLKKDEVLTMESLIGRSPDHLDAFVLMAHRVLHQKREVFAGAVA